MTIPAVETINRNGSRFYVHPATQEQAIGVTSVVGMLPKPFLVPWAAKMAAEAAVKHLDLVSQLASADESAAIDFIKQAHRRITNASALRGSEVHDAIEALCKGRPVPADIDPSAVDYVKSFQEWLERYQPEFLAFEATVWNHTYNYAGTLDAIAKINDEVILLDYKTSNRVYAEAGLQLNAYARAEEFVSPTGEVSPMPDIDAAAVVHLSPKRARFVPVRMGDDIFEVFLALLRTARWKEIEGTILGKDLM